MPHSGLSSLNSSIRCYCSLCRGVKPRALKTIKKHLKQDELTLRSFGNAPHHQISIEDFTQCIRDTRAALEVAKDSNPGKTPVYIASRKMRSSAVDACLDPLPSSATFDYINEEELDVGMSDSCLQPEVEHQMLSCNLQLEKNLETFDSISTPAVQTTVELSTQPDPLTADGAFEDFSDIITEEDQSIRSTSASEFDSEAESLSVVSQISLPNTITSALSTPAYQKSVKFPEQLVKLRKELLGEYKCPTTPYSRDPKPRPLEEFERLSLRHYITWWKTNGTTQGYNRYSSLLHEMTGLPILSLYKVRSLAENLADFHTMKVDMCPKSCMAFTGIHKDLRNCNYVHNRRICGASRFKSSHNRHLIPRSQYLVMPIMATIRALFANPNTAEALRYLDRCRKEALTLLAKARDPLRYSDFPNSAVHFAHFQQMGLFNDPRDIAFAISSDGAQLTMKRQSSTWVLLLILLNLPPYMRYKSEYTIINLAIPGPNNPGNIESFIYPLFQELAVASEGLWLWDAVESGYFVLRACVTMVLGDMLGSAKLSGMAGHTAIYGDRFTMVQGAKSDEKNGKAIYYPISPPQLHLYNPHRPMYQFNNLPLRSETQYWDTIASLEQTPSKTARAVITKNTGISRLPLCAASPAFRHPTFFPFDPFHLFYENCMAFFWDLWSKLCDIDEPMRMSLSQLKTLGEYVAQASKTLPPAFCGPIRDPHLKRQSQYKIYEWMALLHWYIVPICHELHFDFTTLENFAQFVWIIEYAMTIAGRTENELLELYRIISKFLQDYETLYVGQNPKNISRARLCIFQLIHIPSHIKWNGSVRLGSQATVERTIGELGHRIRSKKAPFANLTRLLQDKELIKILRLYYPDLYLGDHPKVSTSNIELMTRRKYTKYEIYPGNTAYTALRTQMHILGKLVGRMVFPDSLDLFTRWGKVRLLNGHVLRSRILELPEDESKRYYRWFKASIDGKRTFGEAIAFYSFISEGVVRKTVLYHPLVKEEIKFKVAIRGKWSTEVHATAISNIEGIIGIWRVPKSDFVYILQKHPGLEILSPEEVSAQGSEEIGEMEIDTDSMLI